MESPLPRDGRAREVGVLVIGLVSALALCWAAFAMTADSETAGEVALARLAAEVADGALRDWERALAAEELPCDSASGELRWDGPEDLVRREEPASTAAPETPAPPTEAAELLLQAALADEREGKVEEAIAGLRQLLDEAGSKGLRPEALLRLLRLAARADRGELARETWARAREELSGVESRAGLSYLYLCALAAGPLLEEGERYEVGRLLAERWSEGELSMPRHRDQVQEDASTGELRHLPDPQRVALLEGLAGLLPPKFWPASFTEDARRLRLAAFHDHLGALPEPGTDARWEVHAGERHHVLVRGGAEGGARAHVVTASAFERGLQRAARLPAGFSVRFDAGTDRTRVRGLRALPVAAGSARALEFSLHHEEPAALRRAERERLRLLRLGFLLLAGLVAAASFATRGALARSRKLGRMKTAFVASVSHDLRTPLSSILLMAENLESGRVSGERAQRYHALIRREGQRLRRMVDDVLDFARLERGKAPQLSREEVDLATFWEGLVGELEERCQSARVEFQATAAELPPTARLDADALRRAIWNLVENALKHSGSERVELAAEARGGGRLRVCVRDFGRGIPAAARQRIFDPYVRLQEEGTTGSGLGLAIVREIARAHGGEVRLEESGEGPGVSFALELPTDVEDEA